MSTIESEAENRAVVRREIDEAWNGDDLDVLDELYAESVVVGTKRTGSEGPLVGREDIKSVHAEWDEGFPDASAEVNELAADGDVVFVWWTLRGTHRGTFRGVEPTGNEIAVDGFSFRRLRDGRVVELKDAASMATLVEQLGLELPLG
ncbi:ester cyclase [Halogeometricum limi]|uniref:SnoaL-like polyketide cyclase n=1 Tax=Halogeometricum limi TaxID=555875 RepID=A0A1I6GLH0_9EURY|nr:ester cyclase [Halogeometricum limi]SFR43020.1 conserved hypothetical protein, steroid delta-isomerase-related [Halogeometricum limi]